MSLLDRSSKFPFQLVFCAVLVFALVGNISPAGALDSTFGGGGVAFTRVGNTSICNDLAIQTDGKIIVVGYTPWNVGSDTDFAVARFNTNGTLDTSFDGDGKVITPFGASYDIASTVAIQADGKIIAAGSTVVNSRDDFSLARYNPDGSLDTTFDGDGKVITSIGAGDDDAQAIAIQPDGKIIVAGTAELVSFSSNYFALARYNPDGSPDTTFDGDGKLTTFFRAAPSDDKIYEIVIQPDGKILAAGWSHTGISADYDFAVARYNADGSLDTTFDGDGKLTTPISVVGGPDGASGMTLQPDGKIVAVGSAYAGENNSDSVVVRYNANGSLDTTFDGDGKLYFSFGVLLEDLFDVAIQPDGKIVAAGHKSNFSGSPTSYDIAVARLNPNGSFDTTFDSDGKVIAQTPPYGSNAKSLKIQPNGKITTAGSIFAGNDAEFVVARFMGDVNNADFDGDTKTDLSIFRPSNGQWWYQYSSNNSVLALTFGSSNDKITPGDYTGDGKTDFAFWRPSTGEWFILRSEDFSQYYSHPFGTNGDIPAPADFDGDGKTDEAVFRPSTATWYILRSSGGVTIQQFGANGDIPVPSDFDGDGKADIAIYRLGGSPNGSWWIQRSSDMQVFATHFGDGTDKPVPGDYTGDSKTDLAFWRPSTGFWYVLRSEDLLSYYAFGFGTNGDVPAPGDYDGDGKNDAAVFRPSTGTWYLQRSTAGLYIQQFGTNGDKPVPNAFSN